MSSLMSLKIQPERASVPFHLLIKPVGASCNLACDYCYYPQPEAHKPQVIDSLLLEDFIKNYIHAQPLYSKEINFVWQGGEPLIAGLAFYKAVIGLQEKHAPSGVLISNSLQTNATLLNDDWCVFFKQHQFVLGISIDGPPEIHNRYRQSRGTQSNPKKGSHADVLAGLRLLQKHDIAFNTLTVVHDEMSEQAIEIYDYLVSIGVKMMQFQPLMLEGLASKNWELSAKGWGYFLSNIYQHWQAQKHFGKVFIMNVEHALAQYFTNVSPTCVHSARCGSNLSLETKGQLYACDHLMNAAHYLGDYAQKSLAKFVEASIQHDFGIQKSTRQECQSCAVKMMCQGGCPAHLNAQNENHLCAGYFEFFNRILNTVKPYTRDKSGFIRWLAVQRTSPAL